MRLRDILDRYHKELDAIYGRNEVDSFFSLLMAHYLNLKRIHLALEPEYELTKTDKQPFYEALASLKLEKPIQYILGETEFYGLVFKVNEHTLIPRPETEELVEWVLKCHKEQISDTLNIIDIGTGTGCIAISLSKHLPNAIVKGIDVSMDALKVAKNNAKLNDVAVEFTHDNILNTDLSELDSDSQKYNIIVSNPPYVRNLEKAELNANVLNNEPHLALFVDDDNPFQFYKAICEFARKRLTANGILFFEINEYLGDEMVELMIEYGFSNIELKKDMFGKHRMLKGSLKKF